MSFKFSLIGSGDGVNVISDINFFDDVFIYRDYSELKVIKGDDVIFHTDSEKFLDFKSRGGKCGIEMHYGKDGIKEFIKSETGECMFFSHSFDGFDKWNFIYSDFEIVPMTKKFKSFYIRFYQWRFLRSLKVTVMSLSNQNDLLDLLCIAAYMWLKQEMTRHDP